MKLISQLEIKIDVHFIGDFIQKIFEFGCKINKMELLDDVEEFKLYLVDLIYFDSLDFFNFIDFLKNSRNRFLLVSQKNFLEEHLKGGLLQLNSKLDFNNSNEYEMNLEGAFDLIFQKIKNKEEKEVTGINNNIIIIDAIDKSKEDSLTEKYNKYALCERQALIIKKFTGFNCFPMVFTFDFFEDFVKVINSVSETFIVAKILNFFDLDLLSAENFIASLNVPVVSESLDDIPVYLMGLLNAIIKKHKFNKNETTVGFIGVDLSILRFTRLILKNHFFRVLGCHDDNKILLSFENLDGLATTGENIFANADVVFIMNDMYDEEKLLQIRPGVILVSLEDISEDLISQLYKKGLREYVKIDRKSFSIVSSGLIKGLLSSSAPSLRDEDILMVSNVLSNYFDGKYFLPDVFSDIHLKIESSFSK